MRIFLDTNVIISAFVTRGACSDLFEHCLAEHAIYVSQQVIDELKKKSLEKIAFSQSQG